jgi:hypothetical protein
MKEAGAKMKLENLALMDGFWDEAKALEGPSFEKISCIIDKPGVKLLLVSVHKAGY